MGIVTGKVMRTPTRQPQRKQVKGKVNPSVGAEQAGPPGLRLPCSRTVGGEGRGVEKPLSFCTVSCGFLHSVPYNSETL